jgi:HEAT repeat protein
MSTNKSAGTPNKDTQEAKIDSLIADLTCDDVVLCQKARKALVSIGKPAVPSLVKLLPHQKEQLRWEAVKALSQIADSSTTRVFLDSLEDKDFDIRWLAAEGLIAIGKDVLAPLLKALINHSDSIWFRNGAHHVLHDLARRGLYDKVRPVLFALEDVEPSIEVPLAAKAVLSQIE